MRRSPTGTGVSKARDLASAARCRNDERKSVRRCGIEPSLAVAGRGPAARRAAIGRRARVDGIMRCRSVIGLDGRVPRRGAALEGLDDDHAAAAARAWERVHRRLVGAGVAGLALRRRDAEQLAGAGDVLGAPAVGEQAVVADAVEAVGQDVDEEAADELVARQRHDLVPLASLGAVVLPPEGDAASSRAMSRLLAMATRWV